VLGFIQVHQPNQPTTNLVLEAHAVLLSALDRRLGSLAPLAPLAMYDLAAFGEEVAQVAGLTEMLPMRGGSSFWPDLLDWCQWWLGYTLGAFCLRERRIGQRKNANRRIRFAFFRSPLALFRPQTPGISRLVTFVR
jgi:hypothetical protein